MKIGNVTEHWVVYAQISGGWTSLPHQSLVRELQPPTTKNGGVALVGDPS